MHDAQLATDNTTRLTWDFLVNTVWYVKQPDLPALQFTPDTGLLAWQGDQTVWHITGYKNGYFWGITSAVMFDPDDANSDTMGKPRQLSLIGTVTASGQVQITFIRASRRSESITTGFGQLTQLDGAWVFQMQMSTPSGDNQLLHWANMAQTVESDASWKKLPGVPYSVPDMLDGASYPQFGDD